MDNIVFNFKIGFELFVFKMIVQNYSFKMCYDYKYFYYSYYGVLD